MILKFELSMPGVSSWNGQWTGQERLYVIFRTSGRSWEAQQKAVDAVGYFSYDFGDGWRAGVTVSESDSAEKAKLMKKSAGFCGYDWMVDEIIKHGRIKKLGEENETMAE